MRTPHLSVLATAGMCMLLAGCSTPGWITSFKENPPNWLTPYRVDIGQGNFISEPMTERLQKGMSREQVRAVLGTPLLVDPFRNNRWDYVFDIRRGDGSRERRRFSVHFDNDQLASWGGDALPRDGGDGSLPRTPKK